MPGSAAGHQGDPFDPGNLGVAQADLRQGHLAGFRVDPAADGVADRQGLLVDLLEHEVLVTGLLGHARIPVNGPDLFVDLLSGVQVSDLPAVIGEDRHLPVVEKDHLTGIGEQGRDVRGQQRAGPLIYFIVLDAEHQGALVADRDQDVRLA